MRRGMLALLREKMVSVVQGAAWTAATSAALHIGLLVVPEGRETEENVRRLECMWNPMSRVLVSLRRGSTLSVELR